MNDEIPSAADPAWPDVVLFLVAITAVFFVLAMWTTSIPLHIALPQPAGLTG